MTVLTAAETTRRDWRSIGFRIVAGLVILMALVLFGSIFSLVSPWVGPGGEPEALHPEMHRWHSAIWATMMAILVSGSLLASLRRPRENPVLVQFVALALGVFALVGLLVEGFNPEGATLLVIAGLLVAAYPAGRALADLAPARSMSMPLLALTLIAAVLLAPYTWQSLQLQLAGGNEHAELSHWIGSAVVSVLLVLGGALAATRRAGSRALGTIVGIAFLYLGSAALSVPNHDGSWGMMGGIVALLGGAAFIAATYAESRAAQA